MQLNTTDLIRRLAWGTAAIAFVPITAWAQATPTESAPANVPAPANVAPTDAGTGNDIVVTAQKRSEKVQDIPKAVEVVTQQALIRAGVTGLQDLARVSPSIQGTSNAGSPPAIRGISSFAFSIGVQAQTGVVLDDVSQPNFSTLADELGDIDRVEILPGPQSTLSGRNAAGGLINLTTRNPSKTLTADFTGEVTNDRQKRLVGSISAPLSPTVGFSLSGYWDDWDGPLYNITTGHHVGGYDRYGVRGKLRFELTSKLTATLTGYYAHNSAPTTGLLASYPYVAVGSAVQSYFVPGVPLVQVLPYAVHSYNHDLASKEGALSSNDYGGTLRLDYDTGLGTLSSISNIARSKSDTSTPIFGPLPNITQNYKVDYKTQEFRLTSPASMSKLKYLIGLYYTDTKISELYDRQIIGPVDWNRTAKIESLSAYGNATYEFLDGNFVGGGLRYQHDHLGYDWQFLDGTAPESRNTNNYDFVAGEANLRHQFSRDASVYFTYANAQTGRAYDIEDNVDAATPAGLTPLASEKVHSFEGGFKTQWFDRRLTFNISAFDANYSNYQVQNAYLPAGASLPSIRLFSVGKVETRGIEVDTALAVTSDFRLTAAATLLDAKIKSYPNAVCYNGQPATSCIGGTQNLSGAQMPGASHFKTVITASYLLRLPTLPFDATFDALFRYQSSFHADVTNDPASHVGAYGVVNVAAGVKTHDGRAELQIFANNVLDKKNYAALFQDTVTFDPTGAANPAAVYAAYARDSERYGGLRLKLHY